MADASVQIRFVGNSGSAVGAVKQVEGAFSSLAGRAKALIGVLGVAGIAGGLIKAGRTALDFDKNMRNVNSLIHLSEKEFKGLSKEVLKLAGPTAQAPKTLAAGLYDIVSSGFKANDAMKILKVSGKAATAGLTDAATAAKAVNAALNAYHLDASQARKISDVLFQTVASGVLTFEELAQNMGDLVPVSAPLGIALEEVGAAIATITLQGVPAAEAATRVKNAMLQLTNPSEALTELMAKWGYDTGQAAIKGLGFDGVLRKLQESTGGNVAALQKLFPEQRAALGILGLLTQGGQLYSDTLKQMDGATKGAGATQKAFAEQAKSLSFQWDRAKASLAAAAIPIAQLLFPALVKGAQAVGDFAGKVGQHMPEIKARFGEIAGVVGTVGGALARFATSDFGSSLLVAAGSMLAMTKAIGGARAALAALVALGLGGWAGAGVAAVGLLSGALFYLSQRGSLAEQTIRGIKAAINELQGAGQTAAEVQRQHAESIYEIERAELGVQQALGAVRDVQEQVTAGTLKGKDADLAMAQVLQNKRDAYRRLAEAQRNEKRLHEELAAARDTETQAAAKARAEVDKGAESYRRAFDLIQKAQEQGRMGVGVMIGLGAQGLSNEASNVKQFAAVMRTAIEDFNRVIADPKVSTETRNRAKALRDAAGAALLLATNTGKIPSEKKVEALLEDGKFRAAVRTLLGQMGLLKDKTVKVKADGAQAAATMRALSTLLSSLHDKTVTITTIERRTFQNLRNRYASGGFVTGPETGGRDAVHAMLAPGELVLNRSQQNALGGPAAIASMFGFSTAGVPGVGPLALAAGGFVTPRVSHRPPRQRRPRYKVAAAEVASLQKQLDRNEEAQDRSGREFDQMSRRFDISVEEFITVDADGNEHLDTGAVAARVGELNQLIAKKDELIALIDEEKRLLEQLIAALQAAVKAYLAEVAKQKKIIAAETARIRELTRDMNAATDPDVKAALQAKINEHEKARDHATELRDRFAGKAADLKREIPDAKKNARMIDLDRTDVVIDKEELQAEIAEVQKIKPAPASSFGSAGDTGSSSGSTVETPAGPDLQAVIDELKKQLGAMALALAIEPVQLGIIGSFQRGTIHVPETGLALVHAGEKIIPAGRAQAARGADGGTIEIYVTNEFENGMEWLGQFVKTKVRSSYTDIAVHMGREADRRRRAGTY